MGLKYTVIVTDNGSPILTTPHSKSLVFYETKDEIQGRGKHTLISLTIEGRIMYINLFYTSILVVLIPPQNMFKMFPHISGLENIAFVKGWYGDIATTIEAIIFNLDWW